LLTAFLSIIIKKKLQWTKQNLPFYRIFVADSRSPRDGKHIEVVGHYDPVPGRESRAIISKQKRED
jgi:ribosomal protein S16